MARRAAAMKVRLAIGGLLAAATLAVYVQAAGFEFVLFDDPLYVTQNALVRRGLTLDGVARLFTAAYAGNWHPLTGISHMLDCTLFGLEPAGHHLTSVALHAANAVVLFAVLAAATGAPWRSAFVAALFALHPLHVESVAWVSARKDVLSAFFGFAALGAYGSYARRGGTARYLLTAMLLGCGLLSKPMLVTFPFVFLLWDYWPLGRLRWGRSSRTSQSDSVEPVEPDGSQSGQSRQPAVGDGAAALDSSSLSERFPTPGEDLEKSREPVPETAAGVRPASLSRVLLEKLPFLALAAASSAATLMVQAGTGAVSSLAEVPLGARLANAVLSYARYLDKMVWPRDLSPVYPHPNLPGGTPLEPWHVAAAALVLLALTVAAWVSRRPYALVGWLWYLGTLVPVIGLVQVGGQAMADRYTYISLVGPFIVVGWGAGELLAARTASRWRRMVVPAAVAALLALSAVSGAQARHWRDSIALASQALRVAPRSPHMHINLGIALQETGRIEEAIAHYREATRLAPDFVQGLNNLGNALEVQGRSDEAIAHYRRALALEPDFAKARANLGRVLVAAGDTAGAVEHLEIAVRLAPDHHLAWERLGFALASRGRPAEAIIAHRRALSLQPDFPEAHNNLGIALQATGRFDEAVEHFRRALALRPDFASAHNNLGIELQRRGDVDGAVRHYREALRSDPGNAKAHNNLAIALQLQGDPEGAVREYREALRLDPGYVDAEYNLGLLRQAQGRLDEAIGHYRRTLVLRPDYAKAHANLGLALEARGDREAARRHLDEAARLGAGR
jgi:tetratricopeptide (TPR) repeat protein